MGEFQNKVFCCDNLELLGKLPNNHVNLIYCDILYGTGKKARFVCSLAIKRGSEIFVFTGEVSGKIVSPVGNSFGFDNSFLPDDSIYTLGQQKDNSVNARYLAIQNFLNNNSTKIYSNLSDWIGDYQS